MREVCPSRFHPGSIAEIGDGKFDKEGIFLVGPPMVLQFGESKGFRPKLPVVERAGALSGQLGPWVQVSEVAV